MKERTQFSSPEFNPPFKEEGPLSCFPLNLHHLSREKILTYFENTWALTELLFSGLNSIDAFYLPPYHNLRHPMIFYYCHPVVFYVNKLRLCGIIQDPINPYFEQLFDVGVDEMSWDDMSKNTMLWPSLEEIKEYRKVVYNTLKTIIKTHPAFNMATVTQKDPAWAFMLSLEHERIHLETSSVLIRELPLHLVKKPEFWPNTPLSINTKRDPELGVDYPVNTMIFVPSQVIKIGKPYENDFYGWDNEYGHKTIENKEFQAGQCVISNGDFLQFVKAEGYLEPKYWSTQGWQWRCFRNAEHPTFWVYNSPDDKHHYKLRTCFELIDMQWSWPVIVNYYEAKAYCAFISEKHNEEYRLITEAEHHCLRESNNSTELTIEANMNLRYGSECAVNSFQPNTQGFYNVFGNVWQWCEDHFSPLPGFKIHPFYADFSTPCFDGEHQMIIGGSFISTGDETTPWARFSFRPHFFQHAGFRVVKAASLNTSCLNPEAPFDAITCSHKQQQVQTSPFKYITANTVKSTVPGLEPPTDPSSIYETNESLNEYLLLHYGNHHDVIGHLDKPRNSNDIQPIIPPEWTEFPKRCAELVLEQMKILNIEPNRFLDIGCSVGRVCFELSHAFQEVMGIDKSASFIDMANRLRNGELIHYKRKEEGDIFSPLSVKLKKSPAHYMNVHFESIDAQNLPESLGKFNVILMANVLCRTLDPEMTLTHLISSPGFIAHHGLFILLSPYSWLESFTPKEAWMGGIERTGNFVFGGNRMKQLLEPELTLIHEFEMPLLIREHARKFQMIVSHGMIWHKE